MPYAPYLLIPIHRRDGTLRAHAIIDASDAHLAEHRWCVLVSGYVMRQGYVGGVRRAIFLHRTVLGLAPNDERQGDHVNGDRLDCRQSNLRPATAAQNTQNVPGRKGTSAYRGVSWDASRAKWFASARLNGKTVHIGRFVEERAAAEAASAFRLQHMPFTNEARSVHPRQS